MVKRSTRSSFLLISRCDNRHRHLDRPGICAAHATLLPYFPTQMRRCEFSADSSENENIAEGQSITAAAAPACIERVSSKVRVRLESCCRRSSTCHHYGTDVPDDSVCSTIEIWQFTSAAIKVENSEVCALCPLEMPCMCSHSTSAFSPRDDHRTSARAYRLRAGRWGSNTSRGCLRQSLRYGMRRSYLRNDS